MLSNHKNYDTTSWFIGTLVRPSQRLTGGEVSFHSPGRQYYPSIYQCAIESSVSSQWLTVPIHFLVVRVPPHDLFGSSRLGQMLSVAHHGHLSIGHDNRASLLG